MQEVAEFLRQCETCSHPYLRPSQQVLFTPGGQLRYTTYNKGDCTSLDLKQDGKVAVTGKQLKNYYFVCKRIEMQHCSLDTLYYGIFSEFLTWNSSFIHNRKDECQYQVCWLTSMLFM